MLYSTSVLPDGHGDELPAPRDVPAVFGTTVCTTVVDREMPIFALDSYDSTYVTVPQMELLTLEGASGVHLDNMVVRLDGTAVDRDWPLRSLLLFGRMDLRGHMTTVRIHLMISWMRVIRRHPSQCRGFGAASRF